MHIIRDCAKFWNRFADYPKTNKKTAKSWQIDSTPGWFCDSSSDSEVVIDCEQKFKFSYYNLVYKTSDAVLVYNTASEAIVSFTNDEFNAIEIWLRSNLNPIQIEDIQALARQGIIVYENEDELFKIKYIINSSVYNTARIKSFVIYPTTECNARCFYCFAHDDIIHGQKMSKETADSLLDFIVGHIEDGDEVVFRWFGGEPLMACDVIDYIICSFRERLNTTEYSSIITTNASLIDEKLLEHAVSVWHLKKLLIPVDGAQNSHNKRKNYKERTTVNHYKALLDVIHLVLEKGIYCVTRVNLDHNNIAEFEQILKDLHSFGSHPNFYLQATTLHTPEFLAKCRNSVFYKTEEYEVLYAMLFRKMLEYGFYRTAAEIVPRRQLSVCEAKLNNHFLVSSDGHIYACEQEAHLPSNSIGHCKYGISHNKNISKWINGDVAKECAECQYLPICLGGCSYYRNRKDGLVSPCTRAKYYMPALLKLVQEEIDAKIIK